MSVIGRLQRFARQGAMAAMAWLAMASADAQSAAAPTAPSKSQASAQRLRIVGGLGGLNQYVRLEEPFWTRQFEQLTSGRFSADIVPFDRAGVPGSEMLRLMQLGVVPFGTILMSSFTAQYPELTAPDLAGLNPDIATLKTTLAAFRSYLEKTLREQHGVEALAVYVYPAQVVFCKQPLNALTDLVGRRVRVSSSTQADFLGALGAVPVHIAFSQIMPSMQAGSVECAVTGSMTGNTIGLHQVTSHIHTMPLTWGLAVFGVNQASWQALPPEVRSLLRRELPRLEAAIWLEAERETADGMACNRNAPECVGGSRGRMVEVKTSAQDERRRQDILQAVVLPRWLQRCGLRCNELWNETIGPARGMMAPGSR